MQSTNISSPAAQNHVLFHVNTDLGRAFYWLSTGLAVLTALLQGLVTALIFMTESTNRWTFRFRLSLFEHWWWMIVSVLLFVSLAMVTLAFTTGNGGDAISVLALSSATFLATVQYTLPAWQQRSYNLTRWYAWSGQSRSSVSRSKQYLCGDAQTWKTLIAQNERILAQIPATPSDFYGPALWPTKLIACNPADVLNAIGSFQLTSNDDEKLISERPTGVYFNANSKSPNVSLLWGPPTGFRRVISRAVTSMPLSLLKSNPSTVDGYDGKGLTHAMGILGRNKGLEPRNLVFVLDEITSTHMENTSTWAPRPSKVFRSFYTSTLKVQYGGLGDAYVNAAAELALVLSDVPHWAVDKWLLANLEHQSLEKNVWLREIALANATPEEIEMAMQANYESSYASMFISLNYMPTGMRDRSTSRKTELGRPDIMCVGLLMKARGHDMPSWWMKEQVQEAVQQEVQLMPASLSWQKALARLLGLQDWPQDFETVGWTV